MKLRGVSAYGDSWKEPELKTFQVSLYEAIMLKSQRIIITAIIFCIVILPLPSMADDVRTDQEIFNKELLDLYLIYEPANNSMGDRAYNESTYMTDLYNYDPYLRDLYVELSDSRYTIEANSLVAFSIYLQGKYPDTASLMKQCIIDSVEGLYTWDMALAAEPKPEYDPDNPPLFTVWSNMHFEVYQRYLYLLLGHFGETGLERSLELASREIVKWEGMNYQWTWAAMGDASILWLKEKSINCDLDRHLMSDINYYIEDWENGRLDFLFDRYIE